MEIFCHKCLCVTLSKIETKKKSVAPLFDVGIHDVFAIGGEIKNFSNANSDIGCYCHMRGRQLPRANDSDQPKFFSVLRINSNSHRIVRFSEILRLRSR